MNTTTRFSKKPRSFISIVREHVKADSVGLNKAGNVVCRDEYFWGSSSSGEAFAKRVQEQLASVVPCRVVNFGNHFARFKGSAGVRASSHYWVELEAS